MKILDPEEIRRALDGIDLVKVMEEAFASYSDGRAVIPPVGELILEKGEVHIKYGYLRSGDHYVVKIASGFYANDQLGLPSGNGLMLLFSQQTGKPVCTLFDEGYLTDVRTAAAGAVAAKHLSPSRIGRIGIVGTGVQARLQLEHLAEVTACRDVTVWGRDRESAALYCADMGVRGFNVIAAEEPGEIPDSCNLIVTATPSERPLLFADGIRTGTHLTAVGSDTPSKQELEPEILARADLVFADSISQCRDRGEIHHALEKGFLSPEDITELGAVISGVETGRTSDDQISVADLTGVAVQDLAIAEAVYQITR